MLLNLINSDIILPVKSLLKKLKLLSSYSIISHTKHPFAFIIKVKSASLDTSLSLFRNFIKSNLMHYAPNHYLSILKNKHNHKYLSKN